MTEVRGILFDVDGTLVDSSYLHTVSWWLAFRQEGHDVVMADVHRAVGMGSDMLVPHLLGDDVDDDVADDLAAAHDAIYSTYWPALRLLPGARDLVRHAHAAGLTTVLASSARQREVDVVLGLLDVGEQLDHTTSSDDAEASKPAPDLLNAALRKADLSPDDAIFVGDAVWDVEASAKAGVRCIGLECGGTSAAELREAGAAFTYKDCADLLAHWDHAVGADSQHGVRG